MRIGLNLLFLLPGVVGGTETHAMGLMRAIAKLSNEFQYWVFINREVHTLDLFHEVSWHNVVCQVPARPQALRYGWEQLALPFEVKKHHLSLLHSLGYVQPLRLPCKSVVTIHDLNFYNIGHLMSPFRRAVLQYFVSRSAMSADHIITVSEFSKKQIVEFLGVPPEKVTVTYNAVKEKLSNAVKLEELEERCNAKQPYIFGLSSPSPHKNIANLVRAFALLKQRKDTRNLKLILSGHLPKGSSDLTKALNDTSNSVRDDIIFTGYVSDAMLTSLYLYAEVFVFPSLYEGFGIPIIEAFSCGAPVVCSKMAAIPEVAGDAALYFDPYNVEEMADAIGTVLSNATLREELVNRGKARVKLFTWEKAAEQTLAVYQKLLS